MGSDSNFVCIAFGMRFDSVIFASGRQQKRPAQGVTSVWVAQLCQSRTGG